MKKQFLLILILSLLLETSVFAYPFQTAERIDSDSYGYKECALGNFGADALRDYTGADIAVFALGDIGITLPAGTVTETDIELSFPNDTEIVVREVTGDELAALLEESVSSIVLSESETIDPEKSASDDFLCISGFEFTYDASAPNGERLYHWDLEGSYTLAATKDYLDGEVVGTVREAVENYCEKQDVIVAPDTGRIYVIGARENLIIGGIIPKGFILVLAAVAILFGGSRYRKRLNVER